MLRLNRQRTQEEGAKEVRLGANVAENRGRENYRDTARQSCVEEKLMTEVIC